MGEDLVWELSKKPLLRDSLISGELTDDEVESLLSSRIYRIYGETNAALRAIEVPEVSAFALSAEFDWGVAFDGIELYLANGASGVNLPGFHAGVLV
ncbi:MAG: hypothetical protein AAF962_28000 [Actinomycetota bacterium]